MDVVVEIEGAVSVHAVETVVDHGTVLETVGKQVRVDEVRLDDCRIAEQRTARFNPRERHLYHSKFQFTIRIHHSAVR